MGCLDEGIGSCLILLLTTAKEAEASTGARESLFGLYYRQEASVSWLCLLAGEGQSLPSGAELWDLEPCWADL